MLSHILRSALVAASLTLVASTAANVAGAQAQTQAQYKVGDRVAMPAGFGDKWLDAVVTEIRPSSAPFIFRVHPLGYTPYADSSFMASQLKPRGSIKTEPIGGIADDPYLLKVQGKAAFRAVRIYPGVYECYTLTSGQLVSAAILNFSVLDGNRYQSTIDGKIGNYRFDANSGAVIFQGGPLDGQRAKFQQASDPPVKSQPPTVTLDKSGDSCDLKMY